MEVNDLQAEIVTFAKQWQAKRGKNYTEATLFAHIVEEIGELARQYVNTGVRNKPEDEGEVENAIGDAIMMLVTLAEMRGLKIEEVVKKIIKSEQDLLKE